MATLAAQFFWYGVTVLLANGLQLNIKEVTTHIVHTIFVGRIFGEVRAHAGNLGAGVGRFPLVYPEPA